MHYGSQCCKTSPRVGGRSANFWKILNWQEENTVKITKPASEEPPIFDKLPQQFRAMPNSKIYFRHWKTVHTKFRGPLNRKILHTLFRWNLGLNVVLINSNKDHINALLGEHYLYSFLNKCPAQFSRFSLVIEKENTHFVTFSDFGGIFKIVSVLLYGGTSLKWEFCIFLLQGNQQEKHFPLSCFQIINEITQKLC